MGLMRKPVPGGKGQPPGALGARLGTPGSRGPMSDREWASAAKPKYKPGEELKRAASGR